MVCDDIEKIFGKSQAYRKNLPKLNKDEKVFHVNDGVTGIPGEDRKFFGNEISIDVANDKLKNANVTGVFKDKDFCKGDCLTIVYNKGKEELTLPKRVLQTHFNDDITVCIRKK